MKKKSTRSQRMLISAVIGQHSSCNNEKTYTIEAAVKGPETKFKKFFKRECNRSILYPNIKDLIKMSLFISIVSCIWDCETYSFRYVPYGHVITRYLSIVKHR